MDGIKRRQKIKERLMLVKEPISGSIFAEELGVSRQVIVQDIALLRASGVDILSTAQGYILSVKIIQNKVSKMIACQHQTNLQLSEELYKIVELGGTVMDVIVEHPLYGEIKANLMIKTKDDVIHFLNKFNECKAEPLSALTKGVHLHTIEADNNETLVRIEKELEKMNILVKN